MEKYSDITLTPGNLGNFFSGYFSYYNTLDTQWQKIFIARCQQFISEKIIVGAEGFAPDNKVKAIIAASAVQLTLGLQHWTLDYFDTIIIHPGDFENKNTGNMHRGETNLGGFVRLSWQSFISGYRVGNDNINLGLHEFSHALRFSAFRGNEQDYFVEHYFNRWLAAATEAYNDIREKRPTIFRTYGGANLNEFMSVCIEHFFETPQQIKEKYPALYYCTAILLNQETTGGRTLLDSRERLLVEQNLLSVPVNPFLLKSSFRRSSAFVMAGVTAVPLIFTMVSAGVFNAGSFVLGLLMTFFLLRYDFNFTSARFSEVNVEVKKGRLLFRNRSRRSITLAQLVSVRVEEEHGGADWEIIYYHPGNRSFYSEVIISDSKGSAGLLKSLWINKIAVFHK